MERACVKCNETKPLAMFRRNGRGSRICKRCSNAGSCRTRDTRRGRVRKTDTPAFETRKCLQCGVAFQFLRAHQTTKESAGRFCSRLCKWESGRATANCATCRRPFRVMRCMLSKRKYCSTYCAGTRLRPEQVTLDRLRRLHYSATPWRRTSEAIICRDGACTACGSQVALVVHHIVPWAVSQDDSPENLTTLCRSCHANVHRAPDGRLAGQVSYVDS